ncbi:MAG: hypothetical protein Kow0075_06630 [Salibacteraceae bacterium]
MLLSAISLCAIGQSVLNQKFEFYPNHTISFDTVKLKRHSFVIDSGDDVVFTLTGDVGGEPGNGSLVHYILAFEVDSSTDSFRIHSDWYGHKAVYVQYCVCHDRGIQFVTSGTIRGKKIDEQTWWVEVDVEVKGQKTGYTYRFVESRHFIKQNKWSVPSE